MKQLRTAQVAARVDTIGGHLLRLAAGASTRGGARDRGMSTAEYAVGIMAACTFALVLLGVVKSDAVRNALTGIVSRALGIAG